MIDSENLSRISKLIVEGLTATLQMVLWSSIFSIVIGSILGIILYITQNDGIKPNKVASLIIGTIVNIGRSVPFVILMISIFPLTRLIVGKSIGVPAAVVSLSIAAIPFVARIMEASFNEVDKGVLEAAKAMGATNFQLVTKILLPESIQGIISNITITIINVIGYSAMAGLIAAGGLGDVAIKYGSQRREYDVLIIAVLILILFVQIIQFLGNFLSKNIVSILHSFKK